MELYAVELAARRILEQATRELAEVEAEHNLIRQAGILHENELDNYKKVRDVAKSRLPELLAHLWIAKVMGDTKKEKQTQAEVDAAQKMIDRCLAMEKFAVDTRLGLGAREKELDSRLRSAGDESPVAKRNNAQNVLAKIELYRREGPRHAQSLAFLVAMLGLRFDVPASARETRGADVLDKKEPGGRV